MILLLRVNLPKILHGNSNLLNSRILCISTLFSKQYVQDILNNCTLKPGTLN